MYRNKKSRQGNFNSHAHVERDPMIIGDVWTFDDFNSHAHVERDELRRDKSGKQRISTHTLTWSVTLTGGK